uniref:Uncharacterized protein n=1 Tax=Candidatus Kentrum sp. LPFa TaxID=2126335 RepID=A0A450WSU8_9GAMM|nr:MAG: hypothetical protein BECKLPF1236B_GA0070989_12006 [Candidatus Kentron sp. LPFa]
MSFVQDAFTAAQNHPPGSPNTFPASFSAKEFKNDVPPCPTFLCNMLILKRVIF